MKFARYLDKNMVTLRFTNKNKKGTINVNLDRIEKMPKRIEKMPKRIANTKLRQKTRRANLVRKKRGIKLKSSTLSLPSSEENIDDLLKNMKL